MILYSTRAQVVLPAKAFKEPDHGTPSRCMDALTPWWMILELGWVEVPRLPEVPTPTG